MVDGDIVGGGGGGISVVVRGRKRGKEDAAAGAKVVGGESVERRERRMGVDDGEKAVTSGIDGEAENGGFVRESGIGDEGFDDAGVGDGGDDAFTERTEKEVLGVWVPRKGFRVEIG